jgi:hypothetical protein
MSTGTKTLFDHPTCPGIMQVEHILVVNELRVVTKEVIETVCENLIIGLH